MKAPITLAIDTLIAEHAAPLLKAHGFRKKGQRFVRIRGDCIQLIEFDRWKYNEGSQGKFGLTLGVFSPAVWQMVTQARPEWIGDPFDERFPPIQNCLVDESVLPPPEDRGLDQYWDVDAERALDEVGGKLILAIEHFALPWFQERAGLEAKAVLDRLAELSRKRVWLSSVYWLCAAALLGDKTAAISALEAVLAPKPSSFFPESERDAFKAIADAVQSRAAATTDLLRSPATVAPLDEPTEGIQPNVIQDIGRVVKHLAHDKGLSVVLVEQFQDFAAELADQYLLMQRGEIVMRGRGKDMAADGVRERLAI